jgi:tetratricopeptide (TPR) repeat protein
LIVKDLYKLAMPISHAITSFTGKEKAVRIVREIEKFKVLEELANVDDITEKVSQKKKLESLMRLGDICNHIGEWENSLDYYSKAQEFAELLEIRSQAYAINVSMASVNLEMGKVEDARTILENALDDALKEGDASAVASINRGLGKLHWRAGDFDSAIESSQNAIEYYTKKAEKNNLAYLYKDLGDVYGEKGEHDRGLEFYKKSISMFDPRFDLYNIANINMNMGVVYSMKKDWKKAAEHYEACIINTEREGYLNTMAWALFNVAEAYIKLKQLDKAEIALNRSAELLKKTDDRMGMAGVHMKLGELYQARGKYKDAIPHFKECISTLRELGILKYLADAVHELGLTYMKMGKKEEAKQQFWEALVLYEKLGITKNVEMVRKDMEANDNESAQSPDNR